MGWKGTLRSVRATYRQAERDAQRRQRELERQRKEYERMQELERAAYEVDVHENRIQLLLSVHKERSPPLDWNAMAAAPEPTEPERQSVAEQAARKELEDYQPGLLDRAMKREQKKRSWLAEEVEKAIQIDQAKHRAALRSWRDEHQDWKESRDLATRILATEPDAMLEAIEKLSPFSDISELGARLTFEIGDSRAVEATLHVHGDEVVPKEAKSLLKSGRLSVKQMPKSKFYELYQDYVCSCVLRVANELFAILPVELVFVTAVDRLLNTKTGHLEETPILSVAVSRETLSGLNLELIDPSDSLENFVHRMDFKKTKGFAGVRRLVPEDLGEG